MATPFGVIDDPLFDKHHAEFSHPERPERLQAARAALESADLSSVRLEGRDATDDELLRVHTGRYLDQLGRSAGSSGRFDQDTYFAPGSAAAARRAAGATVTLVESLLGGTVNRGAALVRPPGHHALPDNAMGFCLLNNVAVGASLARALGAPRVMIVDFDVHHGNGTQAMFYRDPSVLYVSLHQFPFYPGTGSGPEIGAGDGTGYNVNIPLSAGADDAVYTSAFDRIVTPIAEQYAPDLVLLSAGFDAHELDPLAEMRVTERGYASMVSKLLEGIGQAPVGLVLEGGYHLLGLGTSLRSTVEVLAGKRAESTTGPVGEQHSADLKNAERLLGPFWKFH